MGRLKPTRNPMSGSKIIELLQTIEPAEEYRQASTNMIVVAREKSS